MRDHQAVEQETSVLRWGGRFGIAGGLLLIVVFGIVFIFAAPDITEPEELARFPDIRVARTIENGLWLLVLALWITHFVALYRGLRGASLAPALFGSVLGVLGLTLLAVNALPHIAILHLSDLYHAPEATPELQEVLVPMWQAAVGASGASAASGLILATMGLVGLGVAMLEAPAFGRGLGFMTIAIGVVGVVAATFSIIAPPTPVFAIGVIGLIVFHVAVGSRLVRMSGRDSSSAKPA
jgi:hypothetical protein